MALIDKLKERTTRNRVINYNLPSIAEADIKVFDLTYDIDADKLVQDIYDFRSKYPSSMHEYNRKGTYVNAWHSDFQTQKMTGIYDSLIDIKRKKIKKYFGYDSELIDIWANIYTTNDDTSRHNHGVIGFGTVYYPYVEDEPTPLIFDNNNSKNLKEIVIVPKKNMLVVFPCFLHHKVGKVREDKRISVASNWFPKPNIIERNPFAFQELPDSESN